LTGRGVAALADRSSAAGRFALYGSIRDNRIAVSQYKDVRGRQASLYPPYLSAVAKPKSGPNGGTTVSGATKLRPASRVTRLVVAAITCFMIFVLMTPPTRIWKNHPTHPTRRPQAFR
jgi:hypothetical protein